MLTRKIEDRIYTCAPSRKAFGAHLLLEHPEHSATVDVSQYTEGLEDV